MMHQGVNLSIQNQMGETLIHPTSNVSRSNMDTRQTCIGLSRNFVDLSQTCISLSRTLAWYYLSEGA